MGREGVNHGLTLAAGNTHELGHAGGFVSSRTRLRESGGGGARFVLPSVSMSTPKTSRAASWLRDPVVQFLAIGSLVFGLDRGLRGDAGTAAIVIRPEFAERLAEEHRARFGRPPSPSERRRLVEDFVREEVLVRKAEELGLAGGDPIIRRRLAQKMEMVLRGRLRVERPTDDELRAYVAAHPDAYARDERFSFRHAFASRDLRPQRASADASGWIAAGVGRPALEAIAGVGDAFPLGAEVARRTGTDLERQFGVSFREGMLRCTVDQLCGPIESTYGQHVVVLTSREPGGPMELEQARPLALRAMLREREDAALERAIRELVAGERVVREEMATQ